MQPDAREQELVKAFVELADTLVDDYDVAELLQRVVDRCARLLDTVDAGILLARGDGAPAVAATTSERSRLISLLELGEDKGPCLDAFRTGTTVDVPDIAASRGRWPAFAAAAADLGYRAMHAVPMRLRGDTIGSLNLFRDRTGSLSPSDAVAAQGIADIATIGILQNRALRDADTARRQLQAALESRVVIEQAKGVIAQTHRIDMEEAFRRLRSLARETGRRLTDVAHETVGQTGRA